MPRKSKAESDGAQPKPNEQMQRMAAANGAAMEVFVQACQACASGFAVLNGELMGFVNSRLNRDIELGCDLAGCANWSEAIQLQQRWAQRATQEYLTEVNRITDLASQVAKQSWEPVYERANNMLTEFSKSDE